MSSPSRKELIPWPWTITPLTSSNHHCPPPSVILGTFAGINIIATVLGVVLGNRRVSRGILRFLTCGYWGKKNTKQSQDWKYMWIFTLGLQLGANAINAWITLNAPGYDRANDPKLWDLMLFLTTRPRISWIALVSLSIEGADGTKDGSWTSAGRQAAVAESILQLVGTYYMGRTVHWGSRHGYYSVHHTDFQQGRAVRLMIAGSVVSLAMTCGSVILMILYAVSLHANLRKDDRHRHRHRDRDRDRDSGDLRNGDEPFEEDAPFITHQAVNSAIMPWIGSWVFMAGYVKVAGSLYVIPPSILLSLT
jgi:hypothetical protein